MSSGSLNTFNGRNQPITIIGPDGSTEIVIPLSSFNYFHTAATSLSILYGTQLGACLIMLAVVLGMTPHKRLRRLSTVISILSLLLNSVRTLLFSLYFTSSWSDFYVIFTGDRSTVKQVDRNMSITATCLSIPMTVLIEAALIVQASLMIQLWQTFWKVAAMMLSVALVLTTIGFNLVQTVFQVRAALVVMDLVPYTWIRKTYVGLFTSSICWFCFLFNVRLIMHMWTNRSILPSMKGLKAMDVLVITNGVLMFIPGMPLPRGIIIPVSKASSSLTHCSRLLRPRMGRMGQVRSRIPHPNLCHPRPPPRHSHSSAPGQPSLVRHRSCKPPLDGLIRPWWLCRSKSRYQPLFDGPYSSRADFNKLEEASDQ
jgi:Fungal pheromone mating factor STE2 GPCR.